MEKTKGMEQRANSRRRVQVVKAGNKQNGEEDVGYREQDLGCKEYGEHNVHYVQGAG